MTFAEQLKMIMKKEDLTQKEVTIICHVNRATLSRYLSGKRTPSYETASQMMKALGYDIGVLEKRSGNKDKKLRENGSGYSDPTAYMAIKKAVLNNEKGEVTMTTKGNDHFKEASEYIDDIDFYMRKITLTSYRLDCLAKVDPTNPEIIECGKKIDRYRRKIRDAKHNLKRCFNNQAMERSYLDAVSDEYYLALIDREGCVKGVIL